MKNIFLGVDQSKDNMIQLSFHFSKKTEKNISFFYNLNPVYFIDVNIDGYLYAKDFWEQDSEDPELKNIYYRWY